MGSHYGWLKEGLSERTTLINIHLDEADKLLRAKRLERVAQLRGHPDALGRRG